MHLGQDSSTKGTKGTDGGAADRIDRERVWALHEHLLQLIHFQGVGGTAGTFAVSISRGANECQSGWCRQDCLDRYSWGLDARSTGRSNEAQLAPSLHEDLHRVPAFIGILRRILHQQPDGHLERVHPRPCELSRASATEGSERLSTSPISAGESPRAWQTTEGAASDAA